MRHGTIGSALATKVDAVVLVLDAERSRVSDATRTRKVLGAIGVRSVVAMLHAVPATPRWKAFGLHPAPVRTPAAAQPGTAAGESSGQDIRDYGFAPSASSSAAN